MSIVGTPVQLVSCYTRELIMLFLYLNSIFTWLNAGVFITVAPKINAATYQI